MKPVSGLKRCPPKSYPAVIRVAVGNEKGEAIDIHEVSHRAAHGKSKSNGRNVRVIGAGEWRTRAYGGAFDGKRFATNAHCRRPRAVTRRYQHSITASCRVYRILHIRRRARRRGGSTAG